jgi:hypothetical protein
LRRDGRAYLLQLRLFAAGDDDSCSILYKALGRHLAEARGTARDQDDMVLKGEQLGNAEI